MVTEGNMYNPIDDSLYYDDQYSADVAPPYEDPSAATISRLILNNPSLIDNLLLGLTEYGHVLAGEASTHQDLLDELYSPNITPDHPLLKWVPQDEWTWGSNVHGATSRGIDMKDPGSMNEHVQNILLHEVFHLLPHLDHEKGHSEYIGDDPLGRLYDTHRYTEDPRNIKAWETGEYIGPRPGSQEEYEFFTTTRQEMDQSEWLEEGARRYGKGFDQYVRLPYGSHQGSYYQAAAKWLTDLQESGLSEDLLSLYGSQIFVPGGKK